MELTSLRRLVIRDSACQNTLRCQHVPAILIRTGIAYTHTRGCQIQIHHEQPHALYTARYYAEGQPVQTESPSVQGVEVPETDAAFEVLANRLVDELNEIVQ